VTQLSKYAILGIAKEPAPGVYTAPTMFLPFQKADWEDVIASIKDESYRANDTQLQGLYQGTVNATWSIDQMAYPDTTGIYLRAIIGPDTVTPGVATTLSAATLAGANSISTAASIPAGSVIRIDTAGLAEYAITGPPTGAGPFTIPVTSPAAGLTRGHASGVAVQSGTTHLFKQSTNPATKATYSLTVYDTVRTLGYAGAALGDLQIKIDPKGAVTLASKWTCLPAVPQTAMVPTYTPPPPMLGWQWLMTNAGASSDRGLSYDVSIKRPLDVINSSDGSQSPREIFQGALDADGSYKAIFENNTDLDLYLANTQSPAVAKLQQPVGGDNVGSSLELAMSKTGWNKGKVDIGGQYVQASFSLSGIYNAADGGAITATLVNFHTAAY
jgi:hypothetical protein